MRVAFLAGETQALTKLQEELLPIERHEVRQDAETVVLAFVHSMKYIRSSKSAGLQEVVCALVLGLPKREGRGEADQLQDRHRRDVDFPTSSGSR